MWFRLLAIGLFATLPMMSGCFWCRPCGWWHGHHCGYYSPGIDAGTQAPVRMVRLPDSEPVIRN
jgi:hypothetical protein